MKFLILLAFFIFHSDHCKSDEQVEKKAEIKEEKKEEPSFIDQSYKVVSNSILLLTNRIDRLFGSTRADDEANGSTLRASWQYIKSEYVDPDKRFNIRYNLRFPKLQERLKFKFDREAKKQEENQGPQTTISAEKNTDQEESPESIHERAKRLASFTEYWNLRVVGGVEASLPVNPFVNLRIWRPYSGEVWEFNPTFEFFTFWEQGFGTRHSFNVDFKLTEKTVLRIENVISWTDESDVIGSRHGPSLFHSISERRAISFNLKTNFVNQPNISVSNYEISAGFRQLIYKRWFYFELSPALNFPSDRDFERIASVLFKLEAVFGSI